MHVITFLVLVSAAYSRAYFNPYYVDNRTTMVHLFEWKWDDIADECEIFLGPKGFGGIQISPPNENLAVLARNRPWWERYQPISYKLETRSGNEEQFADMVRRCNNAGVRIYVDAIINHMTGIWPDNLGTAGSTVDFNNYDYPGVPFTKDDFHYPPCTISGADYINCADNIRNCELLELKDLDQGKENVRIKITEFMNKCIDYGVAGFRIDAAKHIWPEHLRAIYDGLHDLNIEHGFPEGARPYIFQEVIDLNSNEIVKREEYTPLAPITEFVYGSQLSPAFRGQNDLKYYSTWGPAWGMVEPENALVFIDNHDNQRGHGAGGNILNHKSPKEYRAAVAFMLSHPYGYPRVMSSFAFNDPESGPPMDEESNIVSPILAEHDCGSAWVCEHRWHQIHQMVAFRNIAEDSPLSNWWDNNSNQISFCRGNKAFIAFNVNNYDLNEELQTCLPAGTYCDIISGEKVGKECSGKVVIVNEDGIAQIFISPSDEDMMLAIHVGAKSRIR